jgi:uncharacterized damage-inducible protein DinB
MDRPLDSTVLHVSRKRLVDEYPAQIDACLDVLDDEQVWWRPHESANSVGNLVLHLAGSNRYYLAHVIGGEEDHRDRDAEFAARGGHTAEALRAVWRESVGETARTLGALQAADLAKWTDRTGKQTTFAQILLHVTHHNAVHLGQIVWVTKMLQPGTIDDIWRKLKT